MENCLRTTILYNQVFLSEDLEDRSNPDIYKEPYIAYEFHLSYYNLLDSQGISDLDGYHLALVSGEYQGNVGLSTEDTADSFTKATVSEGKPEVCALTTITKGENDTNYSLNEGEYISVIWKMYFTNATANNETTAEQESLGN